MVRTLIDTTAGLVIHEAEGALSLYEIEDEIQATLDNPAFSPGMRTVWDLRTASIAGLTDDQVRSLIEFNLWRKELRGCGRAAIVATQDVDYAVARRFQTWAAALPWETMVFRDLDEAMPWLQGSTERRRAGGKWSDDSGAEPKSGRVFVDPDRGLEWSASVSLDVEGRFCPVFAREGIRLWCTREVAVDIGLVSEDLLRASWRASRRELWYGRERWWVRWEVRGGEETWTWLESDAGEKRLIKTQYPFPYASEPELLETLESAQSVE